MKNIEDNLLYQDKRGVYVREMGERFTKVRAFAGEWRDIKNTEKFVLDLFADAQNEGLVPVAPAGMFIEFAAGGETVNFFVEILRPAKAEGVIRFPAGKYSCLQVDLTPKTDAVKLISETFGKTAKNIIFANMNLSKYSFASRHTEIQVYEGKS